MGTEKNEVVYVIDYLIEICCNFLAVFWWRINFQKITEISLDIQEFLDLSENPSDLRRINDFFLEVF